MAAKKKTKSSGVPEDGILRTREHADAYAKRMANLSGKKQSVFEVPSGSCAFNMGYRFGVFAEDEADLYTSVQSLGTFGPS